jgi:TPR repeat protein
MNYRNQTELDQWILAATPGALGPMFMTQRGLLLYNQYKPAAADLKIAAEAGDAEAQYYLAEELRQQKQYVTAEAQKWYEAAALQGDLYAMLRLAK